MFKQGMKYQQAERILYRLTFQTRGWCRRILRDSRLRWTYVELALPKRGVLIRVRVLTTNKGIIFRYVPNTATRVLSPIKRGKISGYYDTPNKRYNLTFALR